MMETKDLGKTSSGIQANMAALLSYLAGWITGLIFFLVEKDNKFVRFHAMQSIVVFGAFSALGIAISVFASLAIAIQAYFLLPLIGLISTLLWLAVLILWIILMVKAYQGEKIKLPIAGDIAEKNS